MRQAAGLFDVSHMGLLRIQRRECAPFREYHHHERYVSAGRRQSQYSFLLDAQGHVLDDVWVYRLAKDRYWMVVNAANRDKAGPG